MKIMKIWKCLATISTLSCILLIILIVIFNNSIAPLRYELGVANNTINALNERLSLTSTKINTLTKDNVILANDKSLLTKELADASNSLQILTVNITNRQTQLINLQGKLDVYENMFASSGLNISVDSNMPEYSGIDIVNIASATHPTISELSTYLLTFNELLRSRDPSMGICLTNKSDCTDWVELLHNNAEVNGLKTAIVIIQFNNCPIGHVMNAFVISDLPAFQPSDKMGRLVFIDMSIDNITELSYFPIHMCYSIHKGVQISMKPILTESDDGLFSIDFYSSYADMYNNLWGEPAIPEDIEICW